MFIFEWYEFIGMSPLDKIVFIIEWYEFIGMSPLDNDMMNSVHI